jgi:signal transduction histidine kinase
MAPETKEQIFNLFYSSKGQFGTGLGLFIAKQVVQQHGGAIAVESALGRGSVFCVNLPKILPLAAKENPLDFRKA